MVFNWHGDEIKRSTMVNEDYKSTQNVRRFMISQCGIEFKFDRNFMAWISNGTPKSMGDVADEWLKRKSR